MLSSFSTWSFHQLKLSPQSLWKTPLNDRDSIKGVTYIYWKGFFLSVRLPCFEIKGLCFLGREERNKGERCAEPICVWQTQPGTAKHERQWSGWKYRHWESREEHGDCVYHHQSLPQLPWGVLQWQHQSRQEWGERGSLKSVMTKMLPSE